jgi:uncharacterized membrane protein YfcA
MVAVCGGVAAGSFAQVVTGFGFSLVCAPVLVAATGAASGVRLANTLALVLNVAVLTREWRHARLRAALALLVPAVAVTAPVAYVVHRSDPELLSVTAGVVTIVATVALARGLQVARLRGRAGAVGAGAVSGAMNVIAGVGGPAVAMYALNDEWPQATMRGTLQVYFLGLNIVSVIALGPVRPSVRVASGVVAAAAVGFAGGAMVATRVDPVAVRRMALVLAACGGVAALVRGLA